MTKRKVKNMKEHFNHSPAPGNHNDAESEQKLRVLFDEENGSEKLFTLTKGKYSISVESRNADDHACTKTPPHAYSRIHAYFRQVFPGVDCFCTAYENGLATDIIIKDSGTSACSFSLTSENLSVSRMERERRFVLYDAETSVPVFAMIDPVAMDSNDSISPPLSCNAHFDNTRLQFTLCPDRDWLQSKERAFPVTLHAQIVYLEPRVLPIAKFEDFTADDLLFQTGLSHCYAPYLTSNGDFDARHGFRMRLGDGWRLNIMQSLTAVVQSGAVRAFDYRDEHGCRTLLFPSAEPIGEETESVPTADHAYADAQNSNRETCGQQDDEYERYGCDCENEYAEDYYYKSVDGLLSYNPKTRTLIKNHLRYVFDEFGRLIQIADTDDRTLHIIYRNGHIRQMFGGLRHSFRFAYDEETRLVGIIGSYNKWVQYRYMQDRLVEVIFSDGRKLTFPLPSDPRNEVIMGIKKADLAR